MIRLCNRAVSTIFLALLAAFYVSAQEPAPNTTPALNAGSTDHKVILILPFHNDSKAPGLEWIGEAFSEVLGQRLESPSLFVISREDRLYAFDRVGIPVSAQLSRATLLRIAEQMDVDFVVLGNYNYDGNTFSSKAQLLDMRRLHLLSAVAESGSLLQLIDVQAAIGWELLREIQPTLSTTKQEFVAETKDIRLDALENYVRGVIAATDTEKVRRFKEAIRLNPNYAAAILQLGKTYFAQRDYATAASWFSKVPESDKHAAEASFFLGLSAYYSGNMERAADAFRFVAGRLPLTEVYNNLGVVEARRDKNASVEYLQKAVEGDPTDEDYHFNLGVSLAHLGDKPAAIRQLKEAIALRPTDTEARNYLESISTATLAAHPALERIKRNYDEASFRQLAFAIENAQEVQMAHSDPKKHAAMHVDQGKQQLRQGFYEEAREHFRKALALDPDNPEAHLGLADSQIALNDLVDARLELTSILRSNPTADGYLALAQVDLKENQFDAANENVGQALKLEPTNTAALQLRQQLASKIAAASQPR